MKVVFLSAFFNHHQKYLSDALAARCDYTYIATTRIPEERIRLGYGMDCVPDYVCQYEEDPERAESRLKEADVVIKGSAPEGLVRQCIRRGQPVFRYSERPLKIGGQWHKYLPRLVKWHWQNPWGKPIYMLCASGYTAPDYARFGLFRGKAFRWGYFPEVKRYPAFRDMIEAKEPASILWAGRFLSWKHPDDALQAMNRLKPDFPDLRLTFIGTGEMEQTLRKLVLDLGLEHNVSFLGSMKPEEVRSHMEKASVFLFTSDRQEGWGAVVNEAMNSGCAVIASDAAGSVPYLIRDGENGIVYRSGDVEMLTEKIRYLLENPEEASRQGTGAYETMVTLWNAETAAERFLQMADAAVHGLDMNQLYDSGPCSPAEERRAK